MYKTKISTKGIKDKLKFCTVVFETNLIVVSEKIIVPNPNKKVTTLIF